MTALPSIWQEAKTFFSPDAPGQFSGADKGVIWLQRFAFLLLLGSWLVPLHVGPWASWHNESLAFGGLCFLFLVLLVQSRRQGMPLSVPGSAWIWPAMSAVVLLQAAFGQIAHAGDAAVLCGYFFLIMLAQIAGFNGRALVRPSAEHPDDLIDWLAGLLLLSAVLTAVVCWVQSTEVWPGTWWVARQDWIRRPGGNIAQTNQVATLMAMGVVSLNHFVGQAKIKGLAALLLVALMVSAMGLTESRTGVLTAFALLCFAFVHRRHALAGRSIWNAVGAFAGLLLCFKLMPTFVVALNQAGLAMPEVTVNTAPGLRLMIWGQILEVSAVKPWLGWGLNQLPLALNDLLENKEHVSGEVFTFAHNIVLDMVVGLGYPLTLLIVVAFGWWLLQRLRCVNDEASWTALGLVLPLVVHSLLEYPFAYAYFLVPAALAAGLVEARQARSSSWMIGHVVNPSTTPSTRPRWSFGWPHLAVVWFAFSSLVLVSVVEYVDVQEDYIVARFEGRKVKQPIGYERPNTVLLTQLDALLAGLRMVPQPGMTAEQLETARQVALRFPWPLVQNRYALALALNGHEDAAQKELKIMRVMHGPVFYAGLKEQWMELALEKHPQLLSFKMP